MADTNHGYITIDPGTPELGLWCAACNLPSVIRLPLAVMSDVGVRSIGAIAFCDDCGFVDCGFVDCGVTF